MHSFHHRAGPKVQSRGRPDVSDALRSGIAAQARRHGLRAEYADVRNAVNTS